MARHSLRWAAQFGDLAAVTALLSSGADPDEIDGTSTPLCMACFHRKVPVVRALLAAGASPALAVPGGSAPLVYAVMSKSKRTAEMVRMLLEAGAEPDPPAYRGMSLIDWCRNDRNLAEVRVLLEAAARGEPPAPLPKRTRGATKRGATKRGATNRGAAKRGAAKRRPARR